MRSLLACRIVLACTALSLAACTSTDGVGSRATTPSPSAGFAAPNTPPQVNVALARANGQAQLFEWARFEPASFERARREHRFILIHGAAAWCHWCHVMEAVTYRDPEIGALLRDRFVAIKVDIDARPDVAERYASWGWPATVVMSEDAVELGKLRGYQSPQQLREALRVATEAGSASTARSPDDPGDVAATAAALPWAVASAMFSLDDYYDDELGGWGRRQKSPLGEDLAFEVRRAARGDARAQVRATQTATATRALFDPVWGGVYQYSDGGDWTSPHFEKLMEYQAENLEAFADLAKLTGDASFTRDARSIAGYMTTHLRGADGAFFTSQDADVGGHDATARFVDGHVFYATDDAGRRALGMPRVDTHVYALENGRAITAFVALFSASHDPADLATARAAADRLLTTHVSADGKVLHDPEIPSGVRFLADAASLGLGLAELGTASGDAKYTDAASRIADAMVADFGGGAANALFAMTLDPAAVGIFAERRVPFDANACAARFLARLGKGSGRPELVTRAAVILGAISTPRRLGDQGRILGAYLLAADALGLVTPADTLVR